MKKTKEKVDVAKKARQLLVAGGQIPFDQCATAELFSVATSLQPWKAREFYDATLRVLVTRDDCTPLQNIWLLARLFSSDHARALEDRIAQQLTAQPVEETLNLMVATKLRRGLPPSHNLSFNWEHVWERIIWRPNRQPSFSTLALIKIAQQINFATSLSHAALLMLDNRNNYPIKPLEGLLFHHDGMSDLAYRWQWTIIYLLVRKPNYPIKRLLECLDRINHHGGYWWCKEKALPLVQQRFADVSQISTEELIELEEALEKSELRELVKTALKDRIVDLQRLSSP